VSNIVDQYENAKASAERVFGLVDVPVGVASPRDPVVLDDPDGAVEYDGVPSPEEAAGTTGDLADPDRDPDSNPDGDDDGVGERVVDGVTADGEAAADDGATADGGATLAGTGDSATDPTDATADLDDPVVHDVRFVAEPGETVAVVGPTGGSGRRPAGEQVWVTGGAGDVDRPHYLRPARDSRPPCSKASTSRSASPGASPR
jgi:ATP-binding cassette subfamily B protein